MRRKLQIVGWVAALLCCAVLWTAPAMAEEVKYGLWIAGKQLTSENCQHIDKEHGFEGVTVAEGGEFRYDKEKNTLFMKDVTVTAADGVRALGNYSLEKLTITLIKVSGENHLNATTASALVCNARTRIDGDGKLDVTSRDSAAVFLHCDVFIHDIEFYAYGKTWGVWGKDRKDGLDNIFLRGAKGRIRGDVGAIGNLNSIDENLAVIAKPEDGLWFNENQNDTHPANVVEKNDPTQALKEIEFDRAYDLVFVDTGAQGARYRVNALNCNHLNQKDANDKFGIPGIVVADGGHCYYDIASKTLFLKNVTVNAKPNRGCIYNYGIDGLTIKVEGENTLIGDDVGIGHDVSTQIIGDGTLTIKTHYGFYYVYNKPLNNVTFNISDINLNIELKKNTGQICEEACFHSTYVEYTYTLNNVKATLKGKPYYRVEPILKGCKVVSAEGASPIEIDRIRVESLSFSPAELIRYVGDAPAAVPQPTVKPEDAGNKKLAWTSDNEEVAKVVDGQLVIGTKGTAHLTAAATDGSNQKAQLTVHVRYRVEGVKLYQGTEEVSALTITEGQSVTLTAKVAPENVPGGVEWAFQEGEFAVKDKTSEKATFTALKAGDYTITAKAVEDNEKSATVTVKVLPKVARLTLHEKDKTEEIGDALTFEVGESKTFEVKQLPAEALPLPVSWSVTVGGKPTDDVTVADGVVTVKKWVEGCTLTVQVKVSESETIKKDVTLTVLKPAPKEIKLEPKELTLAAGETKEVTISFVGEAPLDERVTVTPQDSEHFTVAQAGKKLTITGKKPTTAAVTLTVASTKDPNIKETCQVTVTKKAPTKIIIPESFSLAIEESKEMTVTFEGGDYIDKELDVEPKTNENIEIKQEGDKLIIKGTKLTTDPVTITVKSKNFPAVPEATCQVTVTKKVPTAITIAQSDKAFELTKEQTKVITLTFTPAEYVNQEVEVTVNPKDALTATAVDGKLTIKADKPFDKDTQVTVTVTSTVASSVSDNCTVTLKYENPGAVEDAALESIAVAPNPFSTELRIENPEGIEGYYELLTAAGVAVRSGALDAHKVILNTEALPTGVYFLHIRQGELANTHKTIKVVKY